MLRRIILAVVVVSAGLFAGSASAQSCNQVTPPTLCIDPVSWNIIGLDSNKAVPPNSDGPDTFMVGARACNNGATTLTNVVATYNTVGAVNANINLADNSTLSVAEIRPGRCEDFYFNGRISRVNASYFTSQGYTVTAASGAFSAVTPANRALYIEKLNSQNRNSVGGVFGPTSLQVGGIYTFNVQWSTAPGGYEQLEHFVSLVNTSFRLLSSYSTYDNPPNQLNTTIYADACGWDNNTLSGTYKSCIGPVNYPGGKAGGNVNTFFTVQILGATPPGGSQLRALIYDFSGSSYHYNSDFNSNSGLVVNAAAAADLRVTISDSPDPVQAGAVITYTGTATNAGLSPVTTSDGGSVKFPVPPDTTFSSISMPGWTCGLASGVVTCTPNATFASGASAPYTFQVTVVPGTVGGTTIPASATISSNLEDPTPSNNFAQTTTIVASATQADLVVTNTVPAVVVQGSAFSFTQTVTNNGPATAVNPTFTTQIPAGSTYTSMTTPSAGWTCGAGVLANTITCTRSSPLALNESAVFSLNLTATGAAGTNLSSTAYATTTTTEPNTQNNVATASTNIIAPGSADMAITVTDFPDPVVAGESILYTQNVINNGVVPALNVVVTFPTPPNTTYTYIDEPVGWDCSTYPLPGTPTPGSAGTITCTKASVAVGETASFPLTVSVALGTASGTIIPYTGTVSTTTTDSVPANNTSSVTTLVAAATSADMAIVKTSSSNPIRTGANLVYSLQVTNNGPATATNVTVSDPLPANLTYVSNSTTKGTCAYNAGTRTVSCALGSMVNGQIAVISVRVTVDAAASGQTLTNTATVAATETDPVPSNNTSSSPVVVISATAVSMLQSEAVSGRGAVDIHWQTSWERNSLGFNLYRDSGTARVKVNPSLIAGSTLITRAELRAGFSYHWTDRKPVTGAVYWIESVDLNGQRTLHGPVLPRLNVATQATRLSVSSDSQSQESLSSENSVTLGDLSGAVTARNRAHLPASEVALNASANAANDVTLSRQFDLAGRAAAKILIAREGYYRVTRAQLAAAGFDPGTDPRSLSLYADGVEIPVSVNDGGDGKWDAADSLEFYAYGMDSTYSGTRAYWLIAGNGNGLRFKPKTKVKATPITATSFPFTLERKDRILFFAAQTSSTDQDGFYGPVIWSEPTTQSFEVSNLAATGGTVTLSVSAKGATNTTHRVRVLLNGAQIGYLDYRNQELGTATFTLAASALRVGTNDVELLAVADPLDISFLDVVRLTYPHTFAADGDLLRFPVPGSGEATITGFSTPNVRVIDVTDPAQPLEVDSKMTASGGTYTLTVIPFERGDRVLYATAVGSSTAPAAITANVPSSLSSRQNRADFVIVSHPNFIDTLAPLVAQRRAQGLETMVVSVDDVFDEFGYGSKSPDAIRDFLRFAQTQWSKGPRHAMLVGDATYDPRNYAGYGDRDFVPTRFLPTIYMKAASDDWMADFDGDGVPNIYLGRLPVETVADAQSIVDKIVSYRPPASKRTLIVVDQDDHTFSFEGAAVAARNAVPSDYTIQNFSIVSASGRTDLLAALRSSPTIVNYIGHGSIEGWSNTAIFGTQDVSSLAGSGSTPFYVVMDCLNALFAYAEVTSLAEALLRVPDGGAVAVWASTAMSDPPPQATVNEALYRILAANPGITIGELVARAKASTSDPDVKTTWVLLGDPTLHLQR
ncbi:MAG: C25 family cysteine peptidase [Acidobacteriota bacterium]